MILNYVKIVGLLYLKNVLRICTLFQHFNAAKHGINSKGLHELREVILEKLKSCFNFFKTICKKLPGIGRVSDE